MGQMPPPAVLERRIGLGLDDHRGGHPGDRNRLAAEPPQLADAQLPRPRVAIGADEHRGELGRLPELSGWVAPATCNVPAPSTRPRNSRTGWSRDRSPPRTWPRGCCGSGTQATPLTRQVARTGSLGDQALHADVRGRGLLESALRLGSVRGHAVACGTPWVALWAAIDEPRPRLPAVVSFTQRASDCLNLPFCRAANPTLWDLLNPKVEFVTGMADWPRVATCFEIGAC
jgi:hypothetical protein